MNDNSATEPFADAGVATVEDGHVVLDGPDGVAITLTARAAVATGKSLVEAGERALREAGERTLREAGDASRRPDD